MLKRDLRQLIADSLAFLYALIGWNRIAFFEHKFSVDSFNAIGKSNHVGWLYTLVESTVIY